LFSIAAPVRLLAIARSGTAQAWKTPLIFENTYVTIRVASRDGSNGISVLEHHA